MPDRSILHVDMNSFYASVEQAEKPSLKGKPVVVAGKEELRHGIVLTKSIEAKKYGIQTAEALWQARNKCSDLIVLPPNYKIYKRYSLMARKIYYQYTDRVEPFGLDENWLDLTGALHLHGGDIRMVAEEISERIKSELGVTVSIGIGWDKVTSKYGSDHKKPDAITEVTRDNYRNIFWNAPVEDLLYIGSATKRRLNRSGYFTIGELANASDYFLQHTFGKVGFMIRSFARGEDITPVKVFDPARKDVDRSISSYGNSLTAPHDIICERDAKALIYLLAESVAQRLREDFMRAFTISIGVRDGEYLTSYTRQRTLKTSTASTRSIARVAWELLTANQPLDAAHPVRGLMVRASKLDPMYHVEQLTLFEDANRELEDLDFAIDDLRRRFGNKSVVRGIELMDEQLRDVDIKGENTVFPVGYLHT